MAEKTGKEALTAEQSAGYFVNRELSWLQFNERVLEEARDKRNPLCERLNFISIFQSNLDEFYMVRVGTLVDTLKDGVTDDKMGLTSAEQLSAVLSRTGELLSQRDETYKELMRELANEGVELVRFGSLQDKTQSYLEKYFTSEVLPLLSPQIVGRKQPFPFLRHKAIYAVAMLRTKSGGNDRIGIVPCGEGGLRRLVPVPGDGTRFILMEDLTRQFLPKIFEHYRVEASALIRTVRNADMDVEDAGPDMEGMSAEDYRNTMERLLRRRTRQNPVRIDYRGKLEDSVRDALCDYLKVSKKHFFASSIPLDLSFIGILRDVVRDKAELFYPRRVPQNSVNISPDLPMMEQIRRHDLMLSYPYESVRPFLDLLAEAGRDPDVVSIKMTLYRVAHNSKIIEALVDAAENGKEVVVVVELRARFDEENNIGWSRVLEQAGCRVIYGLDHIKIHSKLLLITSRHGDEIEYISQIGTGNYNEDTVRLYTDFALMTASKEIGADVARVFTSLALGEVVEEPGRLLVAPLGLRNRIIGMIDDEIAEAKAGRPAYLGFKLNGLTDKGIIEKFVEASQAGVKIDLLIRGICCMVGGLPGLTENINIYSIVGRYLEHARIYIFGLGGRRKVYISSADMMTRNTQHRVEVAVPVLDGYLRRHLERVFETQLSDNVKLRRQGADGIYTYVQNGREPLNSQERFIEMAYSGEWKIDRSDGDASEKPAFPAEPAPAPEPEESTAPESASTEGPIPAPTNSSEPTEPKAPEVPAEPSEAANPTAPAPSEAEASDESVATEAPASPAPATGLSEAAVALTTGSAAAVPAPTEEPTPAPETDASEQTEPAAPAASVPEPTAPAEPDAVEASEPASDTSAPTDSSVPTEPEATAEPEPEIPAPPETSAQETAAPAPPEPEMPAESAPAEPAAPPEPAAGPAPTAAAASAAEPGPAVSAQPGTPATEAAAEAVTATSEPAAPPSAPTPDSAPAPTPVPAPTAGIGPGPAPASPFPPAAPGGPNAPSAPAKKENALKRFFSRFTLRG